VLLITLTIFPTDLLLSQKSELLHTSLLCYKSTFIHEHKFSEYPLNSGGNSHPFVAAKHKHTAHHGIQLYWDSSSSSSSSLGPVSLCPRCTSALGLLYSPKHSFSTDSITLCLLQRGKGPLLKLCLYL